jgi:hypothetical protein
LLIELKKDRKWLSQFLIYNHSATKVDMTLPINLVLNRLPDTLLAKLLSELNGIERSYEDYGFPKDFNSAPASDFSTSSLEVERNQGLLKSLNLTVLESLVLVHLFLEGVQTASDISRSMGIQRTETYNYLSGLLSKGLVISTHDRPQKFYCHPDIALKLNRR